MRRLARLLPYLAVLTLLLVALVALLTAGPLTDHVRNLVARELSRELDRDVSIGSASLTLAGSVALQDVHIRDKDGETLLKAPEVDVRVGNPESRFPLLSNPTQIRSIRLRAPELALTRQASGKLNINDLLARPKKPPTFTGSIVVEEGKLTFRDEAAGGITTTIDNVDVSVRYPSAGKAIFAVKAPENEGAFTKLNISGQSDSATGELKLKGLVDGVVLPFALARVPNLQVLTASAGTAEVSGTVNIGGTGENAHSSYDVEVNIADADVAFPWLRQPVQGAMGELRFADGNLRLEHVAGTVAGAPFEVGGLIRNLNEPELELEVSVAGIRYPQIRALFPKLSFPPALLLPSALQVEARVTGAAQNPLVKGKAQVKAIKFRAIPWHDLVGEFEYQGGRLKISNLRAHGSPRQFEADVELDLRPGRSSAEGTINLIDIPLSVLAQTAGIEGEFDGIVHARVGGRIDGGKVVSGTLEVEGAVIRGVAVGHLSGEFDYANGTIRLRNIMISGDTATGMLQAVFTLEGAYELSARLQALDLSAIGPAITLGGLSGQCCAQLDAKGQIGRGEVSGQLVLGPGELQGRQFQRLAGEFAVSPQRIVIGNLELEAGAGEYFGGLVVTNWRGGSAETEVTGRIEVEGAQLAEWIPPRFAALPGGTVSGSVEIGGSLADPKISVDALISSPTLAGQPFEAGRVRLRYEGRRLFIEDMFLDSAGGRIRVTGGYAPAAGLDIHVNAEDLVLDRLGAGLRSRYGVAMGGLATLRASATGPARRPQISFELSSGPLTLNEMPFDELLVAGGYEDGVLRLDRGTLRREDRFVSLSGQIGPEAAVDITLGVNAIDLKTALITGDRAVWRLYRAGVRSKFFPMYAKIPRPLEGTLTGRLRITGTLDQPQAEASLTLEEIGFNGRRIERIEGSAQAWLTAEKLGGYSLQRSEVEVEATHDVARATLTGEIVPPDETYLILDVGNLDLRLLGPWLGTDLELGGMATINFDISGSLKRPILRGDIFADDLRVGGLTLEALAASPIRVQSGVLSVEEIRLRDGPMEGRGSGEFPIYGLTALPRAELHLREARFSLLPEMEPAVFDADMYLLGNRLILRDGAGPESEIVIPGIRGSLGTGAFTVGGEVVLRDLVPSRWDRNRFDVRAEFHQAQVVLGSFLDAQISGSAVLKSDATTGRARLITPEKEPLVVSEARLGLPKEGFSGPSGELPFAPEVNARILAGENVVF
ncbi:MAG: AsmA family protein, partial [Armatimonadetes bacterium]|nr:AsmA family protein [Armatimonadota bacterium]